jgi:hypothetical protein
MDEAFKAKLRSIQFAASAMPTRHVRAAEDAQREAAWERDMPAYKRLRADGLQPPHIDGSAVLERDARTETEVAMGRIFSDPAKVREGDERSKEMLEATR